jgi:hypothetical protein
MSPTSSSETARFHVVGRNGLLHGPAARSMLLAWADAGLLEPRDLLIDAKNDATVSAAAVIGWTTPLKGLPDARLQLTRCSVRGAPPDATIWIDGEQAGPETRFLVDRAVQILVRVESNGKPLILDRSLWVEAGSHEIIACPAVRCIDWIPDPDCAVRYRGKDVHPPLELIGENEPLVLELEYWDRHTEIVNVTQGSGTFRFAIPKRRYAEIFFRDWRAGAGVRWNDSPTRHPIRVPCDGDADVEGTLKVSWDGQVHLEKYFNLRPEDRLVLSLYDEIAKTATKTSTGLGFLGNLFGKKK